MKSAQLSWFLWKFSLCCSFLTPLSLRPSGFLHMCDPGFPKVKNVWLCRSNTHICRSQSQSQPWKLMKIIGACLVQRLTPSVHLFHRAVKKQNLQLRKDLCETMRWTCRKCIHTYIYICIYIYTHLIYLFIFVFLKFSFLIQDTHSGRRNAEIKKKVLKC